MQADQYHLDRHRGWKADELPGAPQGGLLALAAHRASFDQRFCTPRLTGEVEWICTWKCAMRIWPDLPRFSNQMLRYLRHPEGLVHERPSGAQGFSRRLCHRASPARHVERRSVGPTSGVERDARAAASGPERRLARSGLVETASGGSGGARAGSGRRHSLQRQHRTQARGAPCETGAPGLLAQGDLF